MNMLEFKEKVLLLSNDMMISYDDGFLIIHNGDVLVCKISKKGIINMGGLSALLISIKKRV